MKKPIVAMTLFTVCEYTKDVNQIKATLAKVKKAGYDYAQISGIKAQVDPADLRKMMLDAGLTPIGAHIALPQWRENFKKTIESCHAYGIEYAAIPWMSWQDMKDSSVAEWKKLFREFDSIAKAALKEGVHLQYHNHDFEFSQLGVKGGRGGKTLLDLMFETCKVLQGEPDFGWVVRGGMDPVAWAKRMSGRMDQVHLKGWGYLNGQFAMRALGEDCINWTAIVKECRKCGTQTFIVEQDSCPATNDPFRSLVISREFLRPLLG